MSVILLYLSFFISVVLYSRNKKSSTFLSVTYWLVVAYGFLFFSHIISPYHFKVKWYWITPYLLICLLLIHLGYQYGMKNKKRKTFRHHINAKYLFLLSLFGGVVLAFDFFRLNSVSFGMRVEDQSLSIIGVIGSALSHLSILVWVKQLFEYEFYGKSISITGYLSVIIYVTFSLLSGGRQPILLVIFTSLITIVYSVKLRKENNPSIMKKRGHRRIRIVPLPVYFFIALIAGYFGTVSVVRSQISDIDNKMDMFTNSGEITLDDNFRKYARDFPAADVLVEAIFYYSHELPRLKLMFDYYDYPPTLGLAQMHYIDRRFHWLYGNWVENNEKAAELAVEKKGKFDNHTWGTFLCNYITDFGRIGSLIACYLTGLLFGIAGSRREFFDVNYVFVMVWICSGIFFSIQFSPLVELCWAFPLLVALFIKIK